MRRGSRARVALTAMVAASILSSSGSWQALGEPARIEATALSAAAPRRVVWVAIEDGHSVAKVDITARDVLRRWSVNGRPHNLTISPTGKTVATALWNAGRIALVRDGKVKEVFLGGAPHDVKIDGGRLVVANQGAARLEFLKPNGEFIRTVGLFADPHDIAISPAGTKVWATLEGSDRMAVVKLRKDSSPRYVSTGAAPHDILFSPDDRLWVTDWEGAVHVFTRRGKKIRTIPLGDEAHHLDFTPDGREVWITDHGLHRLFVLNTATYKVKKRFWIKGAPHHVTITPDGRRAVVADHERGKLIVYNVIKKKRIFSVKVGPGPHGVWAAP